MDKDWGPLSKALRCQNGDPILTEKAAKFHIDDGTKYYDVSAEVLQGSALCSLLWNLMYGVMGFFG